MGLLWQSCRQPPKPCSQIEAHVGGAPTIAHKWLPFRPGAGLIESLLAFRP